MGNYGVHWTPGGVAFLEQGLPKGGANALGLAERSPFKVMRKDRCNHLIPLAAPTIHPDHLLVFNRLIDDPLVRAMLPVPKRQGSAGVWYVDKTDDRLVLYLTLLSRLSSPISSIIHPLWLLKLPKIHDELGMTNVQPLILTDVTVPRTKELPKLVEVAVQQPRRLILVGDPSVPVPPLVERVNTALLSMDLKDLIPLPWENFGATIVRRYMRGDNV